MNETVQEKIDHQLGVAQERKGNPRDVAVLPCRRALLAVADATQGFTPFLCDVFKVGAVGCGAV